MKCPVCGKSSIVLYTLAEVDAVHRKRICEGCGHTWYTVETDAKNSEEFNRAMKERKYQARKEKEVK